MIDFLLARRELLKKNKENGEAGFTLIELLIVIIVLGILAAIVVFAVGSTRDDASAAACRTDVKAVQLAAEAYNTKNGSYPLSEAAMESDSGGLLKDFPGGLDYSSGSAAVAAIPAVDDNPATTDVDETAAAVPAVPAVAAGAGYKITPNPAVAGCPVVTG